MSEDRMLEIINRIKTRRIELGMSYQDLADKTGMSKSTLQRYETGAIKNIPLDKLSDLAEALQLDPIYLMGIDPPSYYIDPEAAQLAQELYTRPEMRVLFDASKKLSKEDVEMFTALIEKMSK